MNKQLCRICGKAGEDFIHIFKTEGLKYKIETCLPIVISRHSLLPDNICKECQLNIEDFYTFVKSCLQNIIILESQLDIEDSCLKSKRKKDKGCSVSIPLPKESKGNQTEDVLDVILGDKQNYNFQKQFPLTSNFLTKQHSFETTPLLVDYEVLSEYNSDESEAEQNPGKVLLSEKYQLLKHFNYLTDAILNDKKQTHVYLNHNNMVSATQPNLIKGITERSDKKKRKSEYSQEVSKRLCPLDNVNRRKSKQPQKMELDVNNISKTRFDLLEEIKKEVSIQSENDSYYNISKGSPEQNISFSATYQTCLLCKAQIQNVEDLVSHFIEVHAEDYVTEILSNQHSICQSFTPEKKKKNLPNLLKISDLKRTETIDDQINDQPPEESHCITTTCACPNCPAIFTSKSDLFVHLQLKHSEIQMFICGICLSQLSSRANLKSHLENCVMQYPVSTKFYCQICYFGEDNFKIMENHILLHGFLLNICQKEVRNYDPEDYILVNQNYTRNDASPVKHYTCLECQKSDFDTFRKFSFHRRNEHSIFHCDLCNKFYGRNSHLWKHVNRLHKGHPSITCQICFKTSASKYHLAQHFNKIHQDKSLMKKDDNCVLNPIEDRNYSEIVMTQDADEEQSECEDTYSNKFSDQENEEDSLDIKIAPKEIDPSHNLYTNIITNYTPPKGEGILKCHKCSKTFHKKMLLKKHKKNCRPRLQRDLLTRCKSCARIFKDRQSLAKHLVNYHSDYICEICNEKVQSKCEIVSHIRFQHPSSHLVCSICENILRCQNDLLSHLGDHENSYVCQFCGDALPSKIKLKMHILSLHRKILSLSCGICLKLFENQKVLRDHVTCVHRNQLDPFTSCPVCGKNYGSKWKTYDHINKSHGTTFKACKVCLELYESENELDVHLKIAHFNQPISTNGTGKLNQLTNLIKTEPINFHYENNQDELDSETDETTAVENENNSNSSDSEDCGEMEPNEDNNDDPRKLEELLTIPSQKKLSLLEKRLLGSKLSQDESNEKSNDDYFENHKLQTDILKSSCISKNNKLHSTDTNPLTNHSKRTVYVNSNDPSFCEICRKTWPAKKHLWQHYIRCHKQAAATVCGICLKTNRDYESLQIHLRDTHPTLLHGQGFGSNFICRICGRYHNARSKLKLHMVIHENFDWRLLERFTPVSSCNEFTLKQNTDNSNENINKDTSEPMEIKVEKDTDTENNEIYDDMIEQIEESSRSSYIAEENKLNVTDTDSEDESLATPNFHHKPVKELSFNNLLQTIKKHSQFNIISQMRKDLQYTQDIGLVRTANSEIDLSNISEETTSSLSKHDLDNSRSSGLNVEESQSSTESMKDGLIKNENSRKFFRPKAELDSAIKSISDPSSHNEIANECNDFCETEQSVNSLNENEIESAVGSIL